MAHARGPAEDLSARRLANRRRLWWAAAINAGLVAAEVAGALATGSLAVLADAGHVLSDLGAIALALLAAHLAERPGSARRTFGLHRGEVLAALINGIALLAIAVLIAIAAVGRLGDPPHVAGAGTAALGALSLAVNVAATAVLAGGERRDLNLEAVLRHSAADAAGSLAVVVSGAAIALGGATIADPIASLAIAALIVAGSLRLIRDPLDVLMETAPPGLDVEDVGRAMCGVPGVTEVHELHVWSVTPGFEALAAHVVVASGRDRDRARRELELLLRERYGIQHTTLQMEEQVEGGLIQLD